MQSFDQPMNAYQVPVDALNHILFNVLQAPRQLAALPAFAEADEALMRQLLDEMGKFVSGRIAPLNRVGDEIGAQWHGGAVTMPPGFRDAYQAFWQAGWPCRPRPKTAARACPQCLMRRCTKASPPPTTAGPWRPACCTAPTNA